MENELENILETSITKLNIRINEGCINNSSVYQTEENKLLFVKDNSKPGSDKMFNGELEGLKAICSTNTISAPCPIATGCTNSGQHFIVMDYWKMSSLNKKCSSELGSQLADMHMFNLQDGQPHINKFGFHVETCCGFLPQNNTWTDDWITFYTENRLEYQIQLLQSNPGNNLKKKKIIENYWPQLKQIIPKFFERIEVKPSLLHGDLWPGNTAQSNSKPVIFDPATFYGHHEYDIASISLFGGTSMDFFEAYFKKIPKSNGFENRKLLYHLFHYLNHWNHFGGSYVDLTINTFESLLNVY
ncbi:ketosamine-3-kinase-like [Metopolophium dirhodum]|uniref:ketosamine-3-kinase-like n=1 Tax=Metopolophium dirhodum TaxID=44670 RepID=UPI0029904A9E|nr:ketosamine-3-kinase-like [Metopolophium dirhodum]